MKWDWDWSDCIFATLTIVIAIVTIYLAINPWINSKNKKNKEKLTNEFIEEFLNFLKINDVFNLISFYHQRNNYKNQINRLIFQSSFYLLFNDVTNDINDLYKWHDDFNISKFKKEINNLKISQIKKIKQNWENFFKKYKKTINFLLNFKLITYSEIDKEYKTNPNFHLNILDISITISKSTNKLRLWGYKSITIKDIEGEKIDTNKILLLEKEQIETFLNELQNDEFILNIKFDSNNTDDNIYIFSIYFNNQKLIKIETIYEWSLYNIKKLSKEEISNFSCCLLSFKKIFNINDDIENYMSDLWKYKFNEKTSSSHKNINDIFEIRKILHKL